MHQFNFGWVSAAEPSEPAWEAHTSGFKAAISRRERRV